MKETTDLPYGKLILRNAKDADTPLGIPTPNCGVASPALSRTFSLDGKWVGQS
jgi:hypothetical protein